jgi:DNA polymerase-3 subunit delta'
MAGHMIWERVRGHAAQVEMFRRSIRRGRLSHAYLFVGDEGIGKRTFAHALSQCLLCQTLADDVVDACGTCPSCLRFQAGTHPDFHTVGIPEGKSELPIELIAGSRDKRGREGLCFDLSMRPTNGSRRIAVIDDADHMNAASANALLKTLEEPPPYAILILIAASPDSLLPTIRSRCQQVRFDPLSIDDVASLLVAQGTVEDPAEAATVARLSGGSLFTAAQLIDPALRKLREELFAALSTGKLDSVATAQRLIAGLEEVGDTQAQRAAAEWMMRFIVDLFHQALRILSGDDNELFESDQRGKAAPPASRLAGAFTPSNSEDLELLMSAIECTTESLEQIQRMSPVPLCVEGLLDNLARLLRTATDKRLVKQA